MRALLVPIVVAVDVLWLVVSWLGPEPFAGPHALVGSLVACAVLPIASVAAVPRQVLRATAASAAATVIVLLAGLVVSVCPNARARALCAEPGMRCEDFSPLLFLYGALVLPLVVALATAALGGVIHLGLRLARAKAGRIDAKRHGN